MLPLSIIILSLIVVLLCLSRIVLQHRVYKESLNMNARNGISSYENIEILGVDGYHEKLSKATTFQKTAKE